MNLSELTRASGALAGEAARPAQMNARSTAQFVVGSMLLGTIGVFVNEARADPITATWFRCAFGLLGLTAWLVIRKDLTSLRLAGSDGALVLGAAVLMVLAWTLFFAAIQRTSAGLASVLFHVQPLWMLLLSAWLLHERVARKRVLGVLLAMAGLVLATGVLEGIGSHQAAPAIESESGYWVGVGFCLLGALCTACVTLIAQRAGERPAGVLAWWQCAAGMLVLLGWPMTYGWPSWGASWGWLIGLGLVHTALAYSLMYLAIPRLGTDRIAVLQFIYPAVAIVFDWLIYGQRLGALQVIGITIMGLAIWIAEGGGRRG